MGSEDLDSMCLSVWGREGGGGVRRSRLHVLICLGEGGRGLRKELKRLPAAKVIISAYILVTYHP